MAIPRSFLIQSTAKPWSYSPVSIVSQRLSICQDCAAPFEITSTTPLVSKPAFSEKFIPSAEGINFSEKAGLDTRGVVEVISKGAAQSWQMDNRWETMLTGEYDHGFAVDWMRKDLGIAIKEAENNTANIDITKTIDQYYKEVQAMGGGRWDTSSLLKRLKDD